MKKKKNNEKWIMSKKKEFFEKKRKTPKIASITFVIYNTMKYFLFLVFWICFTVSMNLHRFAFRLYYMLLAMPRINLIIYYVCVKLNFTKLQKETLLKRFTLNFWWTLLNIFLFDLNKYSTLSCLIWIHFILFWYFDVTRLELLLWANAIFTVFQSFLFRFAFSQLKFYFRLLASHF